jgi:hypothetical protein
MEQIARSATQEGWGYLDNSRYVLRDRDAKFCASFRTNWRRAALNRFGSLPGARI